MVVLPTPPLRLTNERIGVRPPVLVGKGVFASHAESFLRSLQGFERELPSASTGERHHVIGNDEMKALFFIISVCKEAQWKVEIAGHLTPL